MFAHSTHEERADCDGEGPDVDGVVDLCSYLLGLVERGKCMSFAITQVFRLDIDAHVRTLREAPCKYSQSRLIKEVATP